MQDKDLYKENEKNEKENLATEQPEADVTEEGVVYVQNDDGSEFDTSERTYVAVEGLEEELERREEAREEKESES